MKVVPALGASLGMLMLLSSQALAMTITNRDTEGRTVTIVSGEATATHNLAAGASVEDACEEGCMVRVAGVDDEFEAESGDALMIKGGKLQIDEQ